MKRSLACILTGLAILVLALLVEPYVRPVEGFQAQTQSLPTDTRTVRGLIIYASLNQIAKQLPFIHSNFDSVMNVDMTQNPPVAATGATEQLSLPTFSDTTPKVYYFKLKQPVDMVLTDEMIQMLKTASSNLLGAENRIGFWVTAPGALNGTTYPTVALPAASTSTATGTAATGTASTGTAATGTTSTATTSTDTASTAATSTGTAVA